VTKAEADQIPHGLYVLRWKAAAGSGASLASVGTTHDGTRWFAPCNWTSGDNAHPMVASTNWDDVDHVVLVAGREILTETGT